VLSSNACLKLSTRLLPEAPQVPIIIQESDDKIANTATKNLVKKLQKKYTFDPYCVFGGGVRVFTIHEFKIFNYLLWHQSNASVWIRVLINRICVCIVH
jgi:hypothetical protein